MNLTIDPHLRGVLEFNAVHRIVREISRCRKFVKPARSIALGALRCGPSYALAIDGAKYQCVATIKRQRIAPSLGWC
jgi:hypothetical protein